MTRHSTKRAQNPKKTQRMGAAVGSVTLACLISTAPALAAEPLTDDVVPPTPAPATAADTPGAPHDQDVFEPAGTEDGAPAQSEPPAEEPAPAAPEQPVAEQAGDPGQQTGDEAKDPVQEAPEGASEQPVNEPIDEQPGDPGAGDDPTGEDEGGQPGNSPEDPEGDQPGSPDVPTGGEGEQPGGDGDTQPDGETGDPGQGEGDQPSGPTGDGSDWPGDTPEGPAGDGDEPGNPAADGDGDEPDDPTADVDEPGDGPEGPGGDQPGDGPDAPEGGEGDQPDDPLPPQPQPNTAAASLGSDGTAIVLTARGDSFAQAWGVAFEVKGPQGTTWHAAAQQADGSWQLSLPASTAGSGTLTVHAWANIGSSPSQKLASTSYEAPRPKADLSLEWDDAAGAIVVRASNATCPSGITFIAVGLTPPAGHAQWVELELQADGSWAAYLDPESFAWQQGAYAAELVICDSNWAGVPLGTCRADLSFGTEAITAELAQDGLELALGASGGRLRQAWGVAFEIRGASKTSWIACAQTDAGGWSVTIDPAAWGGGTITATLYANVGTTNVCLGSTQVRTESSVAQVTCTTQPQDDTVVLSVGGGVIKRATNVAFAAYNPSSGAGTVWHQAYLQEDGSWEVEVPASLHGVGTCQVKAYATIDGSTSKVASSQFTYKVAPTAGGTVELGGGDYDVTWGMSGLKVLRIHQALGIGDPHYPRYLDGTVYAVRSFQTRVGLPATGVVDHATWTALGLSEHEWYNLGAYASPAQVGADATAGERVEAMIARAYDYLGDRYVWDASGAPGQGVDCSGLVMQALYAAGVDTGILNPVTHATTTWGDSSARAFYHYGGFTQVSYGERKRGDLIYYGSGAINHIAIYLGNNQIIEAYPYNVRVSSIWAPGTVFGVTRVFN